MPPKRMTANPVAAPRYRPGKPITQESESSSSESEDEDEEEDDNQETKSKPQKSSSSGPAPKFGTSIDFKARQAAAQAARAKELAAEQAASRARYVGASSSEEERSDESGSGSGSEESDSEEDSSEEESEDETPNRRFVAPTFVSKAKREALQAGNTISKDGDTAQTEDEEEARKQRADELLQVQLDREAAERAAGKKQWDDDVEGIADEVDDTDDIDPEAERAAWKLRELKRIKRDREAIEEAEAERAEIERRRNLTAEEREAEDKEFLEQQQEEKDSKGKMGFMQKYFHKGAFFQGEAGEAEEAAKNRDIMGARYQDDAANRELLPQFMQIRDMTKLGKKGRTKYRDLKSEDTGRWGDPRDFKGSSNYPRFDDQRDGPTGANAAAVGERRPREDDRAGREEKRPRLDR